MRRPMTNETTPATPGTDPKIAHALADAVTNRGRSVLEASRERDVLLIFLRHFGCTFCREAVADAGEARKRIEGRGADVVFVHMSRDGAKADAFFERWGFTGAERVADPDRALYRDFGLQRGGVTALFGPRVWARGAKAFLNGYGVGALQGDGLQMPGVFLIRSGRVVAAHRHETAADRPDYASLAACSTDS